MNKMINWVVAGGIAAFAGQTFADEGTIRVKALYGNGTYTIDKTLAGMQKPVESDLTLSGLSLGYIGSQNGFLIVEARSSGSGATHTGYSSGKETFEHDDWTISGGTVTDSGLTMFLGVTGATNTIHHTKTVSAAWSKDELSTIGLFLGLSKSWRLGDSGQFGAISLNGSVGFMSGDWVDDASFSAKGADALGFSGGIGYQIFVSKNIGFSMDAKSQSYSWDFTNAVSGSSLPKFKEKLTSLTISLIGQF